MLLSRALSRARMEHGIAMATNNQMIVMTMIISMKVKPLRALALIFIHLPPVDKRKSHATLFRVEFPKICLLQVDSDTIVQILA